MKSRQLVRQLVYTMFLKNNRELFYLGWKKNLLKCQKISKNYESCWSFEVLKNDVVTGEDRRSNNIDNMEVQLIEQVEEDIYYQESELRCWENYWWFQDFPLSFSVNSTWDWYSTNRKKLYKIWQNTSFLCSVYTCMHRNTRVRQNPCFAIIY